MMRVTNTVRVLCFRSVELGHYQTLYHNYQDIAMFDVQVSVSPVVDLLRDLRGRVEAIREPIREALKGPIRDNVLRHVQDKIAKEPGPVYHPFAFTTDKSRRWYMWYKRTGQFASQNWN